MTRPPPSILRLGDVQSLDRGGGVRTLPLITRKMGSTRFLNGVTLFQPGAGLPLHFHNCDESVLILAGSALADIDGVTHAMVRDDISFIPAGMPHRFGNASDREELRILWTYASVDADRTDVATGETRPVEFEHSGVARR